MRKRVGLNSCARGLLEKSPRFIGNKKKGRRRAQIVGKKTEKKQQTEREREMLKETVVG